MTKRINSQFIIKCMDEMGFKKNMKRFSVAAGLGETGLRDMLTPGRPGYDNPTQDKLKKLSRFTNKPIAAFLNEKPPPVQVPVIGCVSAGDGWSPIDGDQHENIDVWLEDDVFAIAVRGDSMTPVYRDGDTIFAARRTVGANASNLYGQDCVLETDDGKRFIKIISRGTAGSANLRSYNPFHKDIVGVKIAWAAPIIWVRRGGR